MAIDEVTTLIFYCKICKGYGAWKCLDFESLDKANDLKVLKLANYYGHCWSYYLNFAIVKFEGDMVWWCFDFELIDWANDFKGFKTPTMCLILQYLHLHILTILHWSIKQFFLFMSLKMSFKQYLKFN